MYAIAKKDPNTRPNPADKIAHIINSSLNSFLNNKVSATNIGQTYRYDTTHNPNPYKNPSNKEKMVTVIKVSTPNVKVNIIVNKETISPFGIAANAICPIKSIALHTAILVILIVVNRTIDLPTLS